MNNRVIFAAAGHGKTYSLCSQAKNAVSKSNKYVLLISYTNEGVNSLKNEYRKQNNGVLDSRVIIKTWYNFLLSEFIKPYQCLLKLKNETHCRKVGCQIDENQIKSIAFYENDEKSKGKTIYKETKEIVSYFINKNNDIHPNKVSDLAVLCNEHSGGAAIKRLEEIYSHVFIDELQDYAGWDLEIFLFLFKSQINIFCVGDYKQSIFQTHHSNKNSNYKGKKIYDFFRKHEEAGLCHIKHATTTRRFGQKICDFINTIYDDPDSQVKPDPISPQKDAEDCGVYIIEPARLSEYCSYYHPVILRHSAAGSINFEHQSNVYTYGAVKGATYERVVVIPTTDINSFIENQRKIESEQTRAKFYVACTRAKYSLILAVDKVKKWDKFVKTTISLGDKIIPAYKFDKKAQKQSESVQDDFLEGLGF